MFSNRGAFVAVAILISRRDITANKARVGSNSRRVFGCRDFRIAARSRRDISHNRGAFLAAAIL